MTLQEAADMLNEAVTLCPALLTLFEVQVPVNHMLGMATRVEVLDAGELALANALGLVNAIVATEDKRLSLVMEIGHDRQPRKRFAVTGTPDFA